MALPEQIRKQTEAVQELYKQLNAGDNTGETDGQADGTTVAVENASNTQPADDHVEDTAAQPSSNEQKLEGASAEEDSPKDDFVQKYKTLQGMYNAEVPRLHSQNRELQSRVQQMEQLLATLSAQSNTAQTAPSEAQTYVTDTDVSEYGESIDVMRRVSREEMSPVMQKMSQIEGLLRQLQTNVVPQVQSLTQKQAMSVEQQFWTDLTTFVPDWRDINNNQDFQSWLLQVDPFTGVTRQTILEDAQKNLDARRVGNFFTTWLEITGQANAAQNTRRSQSASELEKQVTPGRPRTAAAPSGSNAKTYSPADITKFFEDVRKGKYKGREAERDRMERDIFAAQKDGRIVA
jgi:SepF-like predicted cell division protein (DUF552 family)